MNAEEAPLRARLRMAGRVLHVLLRMFGWAFLVTVLFAGGLGWYAYLKFSPEDARKLAAEQLTGMLHREVTIERLVLTPRGVKVLGLRVRRGRAGGDADLLVCDSALVTVRLHALVRRRLEFDTVLLQAPQISLVRDAQGDWDLSDVFGSSTTARRPAALPIALAAAETVVEDGVLRVTDLARGRKLSFEKLALRTNSFDLVQPFPLETTFSFTDQVAGRALHANVEATGRVDLAGLKLSSATATAERLRVDVEGVRFSGKASLAGFTAPRIEAEIAAPPLGPEQWRRILARDAALALPQTRWRFKGGIPAPGMVDVERLTADTPAGSASAVGLFDFAADTPTLSVEVTAKDADLARAGSWSPAWAAHAPAGRATLRASVSGWPGRLQALDGELSLRGFGATWGERRVEDADLDLTAADEFARITATASKGRVKAIGNVFEEIAFALTANTKSISLDRLAFKWEGSRARLRAKAGLERGKDRRTRLKDVALSGGIDKVDWEAAARLVADVRAAISTRTAAPADEAEERPWLRTFKYSIPRDFPDTTGHVHVGVVTHPNFNCRGVDLMWSIRGITPALDKLAGEARLSFGPGRVNDVATAQEANKLLKVVFLPLVFMQKMNKLSVFSAATMYPKAFDFDKIDGEYGAVRGAATIRYFHVDSRDLVAYAEGTADLGREQTDMSVLTRLPKYGAALPEWWTDEGGNTSIGFRVKGDINKPELEPRFKKIGEDEIQHDVEAARARAQKRFETLEKLQTF